MGAIGDMGHMDRPILFSGEMVKAIFAGRKTLTRRVMDDTYLEGREFVHLVTSLGNPASERYVWAGFQAPGALSPVYVKCPYGKPGDRLWVRENCAIGFNDDGDLVCDYFADGKRRTFDVTPENERYSWRYINDDRRPARFMPKWASRVTLEITGVRAEPLWSISEEDAIAEGVTGPHGVGFPAFRVPGDSKPRYSSAKAAFVDLWDAINGDKAGWWSNPWVWVIEFSVHD